jgi:predicted transposase/invertase (TIGR01784 family)
MTRLKYTFKNDVLFKMLFVKYPELLKRLVSELLELRFESIEQFDITNPEMPPERLGDKFCRLDINMIVDGRRVNLEIQVRDEGDFPERSLFHWARDYSTALAEGDDFSSLPRTIIISILGFKLFSSTEFHSEYQALEITRHTPLTDKMSLHYFELCKLPGLINAENGMELWLALFNAETEEELKKIDVLEVPVMKQAIGAYRSITATPEFREMERLRSKARHDEAQALRKARLEGAEMERKQWQNVVADKDAVIADKDVMLADKDAMLADKDAVIAKLRAQLGGKK